MRTQQRLETKKARVCMNTIIPRYIDVDSKQISRIFNWIHQLSQNSVWAQEEVLFTRNSGVEPSCSPTIVHSTSSNASWITNYSTSLHLVFIFWKTTCLSLLSSFPLLISFLPQPALHCSLQVHFHPGITQCMWIYILQIESRSWKVG